MTLPYAAAGAAHRESRAHNDRVADGGGVFDGVLQLLDDLGRHDGLVQLFHRVLEQLAVLGAVDGVGAAGQQAHAAAAQKTGAGQLHRKVEAHLAAEVGQDGVGLFFFDDALDNGGGQRFDVDMVGNIGVGHDGGGVGVDEHRLDALAFQRAAGLRAGVVELRRLADDDGAGADDHDLFDAGIFGHVTALLSRG